MPPQETETQYECQVELGHNGHGDEHLLKGYTLPLGADQWAGQRCQMFVGGSPPVNGDAQNRNRPTFGTGYLRKKRRMPSVDSGDSHCPFWSVRSRQMQVSRSAPSPVRSDSLIVLSKPRE